MSSNGSDRSARMEAAASRVAAWVVVGFLLVGCGELTSGGVGELEVVVAADSLVVDAASVSLSAGVARPPHQVPPPVVGTLELTIQSFIRREEGRWIELTDGSQQVTLPLGPGGSGGVAESMIVARSELPAGAYDAVRTVYYRVEADVESGLEIDGEPFTGSVQVELGPDQRLQVTDPIELELAEDSEASLVVNLHARRWLLHLDRGLRRVPADDFQRELRVRPGGRVRG